MSVLPRPKKAHPPKFEHIGPKSCASCAAICKVQKTRTAYCEDFGLTFPLYETAMNYVCEAHRPIMGNWAPLRTGVIAKDEKWLILFGGLNLLGLKI